MISSKISISNQANNLRTAYNFFYIFNILFNLKYQNFKINSVFKPNLLKLAMTKLLFYENINK